MDQIFFNEKLDTLKNKKLPRWKDFPELELYMDQVIILVNKYIGDLLEESDGAVTQSMVNNYVKLGVMPAPQKKKYARAHLSYLMMICLLKPCLSISDISDLLQVYTLSLDISELYDIFCDLYEASVVQMLQHTDAVKQETQNDANPLAVLTMRLSVIANIGRFISEKAIKHCRETLPEFDDGLEENEI